MSLQALIFDFDGLILDTETPIFEAWRECYEDHGHKLELATYTRCVGSNFTHYNPASELERLIDRSLEWGTLDEKRRDRVQELLREKRPMPGVVDLLEEARAHRLPCAVASSSSREWVEVWLGTLALREFFEHVVTLDDVEHPKPSPQLFETAVRKLNVNPERTIIFEDSLNGLRAARAAGVPCVIVPNPVTEALEFEGMAFRLESLAATSLQNLRSYFTEG